MCGRFALHTRRSWIAEHYFGQPMPDSDAQPRYNIPPGTQILLISGPDGEAPVVFRSSDWGFRPPWVKDPKAPTPINAKAETVATSRYFKHAFLHHRGLVPADGWIEWRQSERGKQPYYIRHKNGDVLFLAAIWEPTEDGAGSRCAIITQPAAGPIAHIHHRMPMVLDAQCRWEWIDPQIDQLETIRQATKRLDPGMLEAYPVSMKINTPRNNAPELLERAED